MTRTDLHVHLDLPPATTPATDAATDAAVVAATDAATEAAVVTAGGIATDVSGALLSGVSLVSVMLPAGAVCPVAPGNAQQYVDEITGYILWGVLALFTIGVIIGIGSILAGRIFGMPQASKAGVVSIVIIFVAGIGYLVLPGMIDGFMGTGCIAAPTPMSQLPPLQAQLPVPLHGVGGLA